MNLCIIKLHLSIQELETLRWFQHNKEFEPYWAQITCMLMLAHGHDAKNNLLRPWNKPIQRIQLCRGLQVGWHFQTDRQPLQGLLSTSGQFANRHPMC